MYHQMFQSRLIWLCSFTVFKMKEIEKLFRYLVSIWFLINSILRVKCDSKNYGHSKLVLFRGRERYEIDGKSCTVGVAFSKGEKFSCACVNGIWAFYGELCAPPLAMVGGHNHCFQMPNAVIRQVTPITSPMRALSNSLTVFEPNMDAVKTKIYRNVHMKLEDRVHFVTMNSSWTLVNSNGEDEYCLNSHKPIVDEEDPRNVQLLYCTFINVTERMGDIGGLKKGCDNGPNGSNVEMVEPRECQPILPSNSEEICHSPKVMENFDEESVGDGNDLDLFRGSRKVSESFQAWGDTTTTSTTTSTPPPTTTNRYPPGLDSAPGWVQREVRQLIDAGRYNRTNPFGRSMTAPTVGAGKGVVKTESEILELMKKEWENPINFTQPPPTDSDIIITDQLWKYERKIIREKLKIKTPEDMLINEKLESSKPSQLLNIATDVMKILCPLQKPEYFDMITQVFLQMQMKVFRLKEAYVKMLDFKRIEAALVACRGGAKPLVPEGGCSSEEDEEIKVDNATDLTNSTQSEPVVPVPMPDVLKSDGMEPIIESVWKIFVSAHSYCYKNFNQFYNDHHKFTTIMVPFFTNEIHKHWFANKTKTEGLGVEDYAGIIGPVTLIMSNIDECSLAARKESTFPFHLTRPTPMVQFDHSWPLQDARATIRRRKRRDLKTKEDNDIAAGEKEQNKGEVKESVSTSDEEDGDETDPWKKERRIMDGMGFCLKKYNEPKLHLEYRCEDRENVLEN